MSVSTSAGGSSTHRQSRTRRALALAASVAYAGLMGQAALADGTASTVLSTGDRTWNAAGTWTWTGDTGGQVFPGDGVGAGAGTEAVVTQNIYTTRSLNIGTNVTTSNFTIGSFTYQQAVDQVGRQLNVNYQGTTNVAKFTLNVSEINHLDAPGVASSGGTDGLNNHLLFNGRLHINGGNLVINSDAGAKLITSSNLAVRGNIATKFDDSDVTFTGLTLRGSKSFEVEDNAANKAVWNMSGAIRLEGTGQFRVRYAATNNNGDLIEGTSGLTQLVAAAPGDGWANALFERATGGVINRIAFNDTVLNSNLFYDPNNVHVSLGNIQVNGKRTVFIYDGFTNDIAANGTDYTNITGDANSELLFTGGTSANWLLSTNVQATMLGKVGVYDATATFNGNGSMGAAGVADKYGLIVLNNTVAPTDKFEVRNLGMIRGNEFMLTQLDATTNTTLAQGAIIVHDVLAADAASTQTIQNLGTTAKYYFGLGADTTDGADFNITVGGTGTPWLGVASERNAKRYYQGSITANGDFTLASGRFINGGQSLIMGNSTSPGGISVVNNTGGTGRVNVTLDGRIDFNDDLSDYSAVNFIIKNQTEARFYADGAMGSATATVQPGGVIIASSSGAGSDKAFNGNVHIQSGGAIQINARDLFNNAVGLSGTGTITRDPNIIVWLNSSEAINGPQFGPSHIQNGDLVRVEANDILRFEELPGNITVQVKGADRSFANGININGGRIVNDQASRTITVSGAGGANTINVGSNGATFAASSRTLSYADSRLSPLLFNGMGNIGGNITGNQTLTVAANVSSTAAGSIITIGSETPIDGLNMLGSVVFQGEFNHAGSINKVSAFDLIFNNPNTVIAGDLISGGSGNDSNPNVKFGFDTPSMTNAIVSGSVLGGSLIMKGGTKVDLNIDTASNNGTPLSNDNRLDVNLKIRVEGGMSLDGKRIYVNRRDTNTAGSGLINLNQITIAPGATIAIDEVNTDVRVKNATVLGSFTTDQGSSDGFEFENLNPAMPITINTGVVSSTQGNGTSDIGLLGTISSNVTFETIRSRHRLENGVVFNGTINTIVPTGGDSLIRVLAGANGNPADRATGTGVVNLGGTNSGSGGNGFGEDLFVYVNDDPANVGFTNVFPVKINVPSGLSATIGSERGTELAGIPGGMAEATNVRLQENSTLYLLQNSDTGFVADVTLEGNATLRKNDGDATSNRIYVRNLTGAFDANVNTGATNRALTFIGNATNNRIVVGSGNTASAIQLDNGANLPSVEAGSAALVNVPAGQTGSVARLTSANAATNAVNIDGKLVIRPAANAAASTTSVVKTLNIAGGDTPTGTLDLGAYNRLAIDYAAGSSPLTTVRNQIIAGYAAGAWNGPGITSSSATNNANLAVGYGEASDILGATGGAFGSATVDGDTVLVRSTLLGDATLDGAVNFNDLVKLAQNYNIVDGSRHWSTGDFNYDGNVDFNDLVKLAQNYNAALPSDAIPGAPAQFGADLAAAFAAVPEPGALGLLGIAAAGLAGRRRRRAK